MTGTGTFIRMFLRRDRWMMFWWIAGGTLLYFSQAPSVDATYTSQAEFDRAAASMEQNVAFIAMTGPARALNTVGGQVAWQAMAFGAIIAGLMSMFIIGRHTRAEEESGRDELVRAAAVGRHAPIVAAFVTAAVANVVMGVLITLSLLAYGLDAAGCIALGVALVLTGLTFTGVALVAAQLTDSTRAMYGVTGAVIAVAYALRAVGDVAENGLSWLSPIGWGQAMHPFSGERWWPVVLPVVATVALVGAAFSLFARRDVGSGLWPARPGPARAGAGLLGTLGLAWRLQRGSIIGWTLGILLLGISYGSIGNDVQDLMGSSDFSELGAGQGIRHHRVVLRLRDPHDRAHRRRVHDLVGAAAARRGGRRPHRDPARDRAATAHLAPGSCGDDGARIRDRPDGRRPRPRARVRDGHG